MYLACGEKINVVPENYNQDGQDDRLNFNSVLRLFQLFVQLNSYIKNLYIQASMKESRFVTNERTS